jgi:hypothetical protein
MSRKPKPVQLALGFGASVALLILATVLSHSRGSQETSVDTIGVLQLMWLIKDRPELLRHLSEVEEPTVDNLREAGRVEVRLAGDAVLVDGGSPRRLEMGPPPRIVVSTPDR